MLLCEEPGALLYRQERLPPFAGTSLGSRERRRSRDRRCCILGRWREPEGRACAFGEYGQGSALQAVRFVLSSEMPQAPENSCLLHFEKSRQFGHPLPIFPGIPIVGVAVRGSLRKTAVAGSSKFRREKPHCLALIVQENATNAQTWWQSCLRFVCIQKEIRTSPETGNFLRERVLQDVT